MYLIYIFFRVKYLLGGVTMKKLSKEVQEDISRQMGLKSRDIDMCMINALDDFMPRDMLLDCLTLFLNKDGGYGHALHIDNYNINSSPYQVYEAFRLINMVDIKNIYDNELYDMVITKPLNYLFNKVALINNRWNPNVKTNNDFAHSNLFTYSEENSKEFGYHPTVALVGYTLNLCKPTKVYYKKALVMAQKIIADFKSMDSFTRYEMVSFNSFLNSIKKAKLFEADWAYMEEKLIKAAEEMVELDFTNPDCVRPMEVAFYLSSPKLDECKELELDYLCDSIKSYGLWAHNKDWGTKKYAEEDSAMLKWVGAESVNNYFILKKYGRME